VSIFELFRRRPTVAATAKERLQIVLAHERAGRDGPDFLPRLQRDLLEVVKRYVAIDDDKVAVKLQRDGVCSLLEVNVELPVPPSSRPRAASPATAGA
jgi:cell division topological specificity factor